MSTINSSSAQSTLIPLETSTTKRQGITRRGFLKAGVRSSLGLSVAGLGSLGYATKLEPHRWSLSRHDLLMPRLPRAFDGYRVLHASDLHCDGAWMNRARLSQIIELINREAADLITLTGDFVSYDAPRFAPDVAWALQQLRARDGVFAVLGNHDHWSGAKIMRSALREAGVRELPNRVHMLRRRAAQSTLGEEMLHIAGVDDWWMQRADVEAIVRELPPLGASILLAHEPDFADISAATGRFDLQLSGHSHGGQVRVPGIGPLVLPKFGQKYHTGLYELQTPNGKMLQFTTRGLGMVGPHVRFNCPPEIAILTLRCAN